MQSGLKDESECEYGGGKEQGAEGEPSQAWKRRELSSSQEADVIRASLDDKCSAGPMPAIS